MRKVVHLENEDVSKLVRLARSCRDVLSAAKLYSHILRTEHRHNKYLNNVLVEVFLRCGCLDHALGVFHSVDQPSLFCHNLLITAYAKSGEIGNAKSLFDQMHRRERASWNSLLQGLARRGELEQVLELAERMPSRNRLTWTVMVQAYAQHGHLHEAREWFECMPEKDVVVWTVMLDAYASNGKFAEAEEFFDSMPERNEVSWNTLNNAFQHAEQFDKAAQVFNLMPCWSVTSWNSALALERRRSRECFLVFNTMPERDMVSWSSLLCAFLDKRCVEEARDVFFRMPWQDQTSWTALLVGLVENGYLEEAEQFFHLQTGLRNVVSWTALAQACGCSHQVLERIPAWSLVTLNLMLSTIPSGEAFILFNRMPERSSVSWIVTLQSYAREGHSEQATETFHKMPSHSTEAWNVLLKSTSDSVGVVRAQARFERMPERDVVSWTTLVQAFAEEGDFARASDLFERMPEHDTASANVILQARPCRVIFSRIPVKSFASWSSLVQGYIRRDRLEEARLVLGAMPVKTSVLETELLMACARKGDISQATRLFNGLMERDLASWNAMILGLAYNGQGRQAVEHFAGMALEGVDADEKTFTVVLAACCYGGEYEGGEWFFCSMVPDYGIEKPSLEHYCCMIELVGRCKELKQAEELVNSMPFWPDLAAWTSLLAACRAQGDVQLAKQILETDCFHQASPYLTLDAGDSESIFPQKLSTPVVPCTPFFHQSNSVFLPIRSCSCSLSCCFDVFPKLYNILCTSRDTSHKAGVQLHGASPQRLSPKVSPEKVADRRWCSVTGGCKVNIEKVASSSTVGLPSRNPPGGRWEMSSRGSSTWYSVDGLETVTRNFHGPGELVQAVTVNNADEACAQVDWDWAELWPEHRGGWVTDFSSLKSFTGSSASLAISNTHLSCFCTNPYTN